MDFEVSRFGGGTTESQILPFTLLVIFVSSALILFLPRKYVIVPLIFAAVLIPLGQVAVIGPFHFFVLRILILMGWVRLIGSGIIWSVKSNGFTINSVDRMFVLWSLSNAIAFLFLYPHLEALINRSGFLYGAIGTYFLLRFLIQDSEDIDRVIRTLAIICVIVAMAMVTERFTGRNMFSVFGGVPEFTGIRDGQLRSQGPFAHAILAGTFGAVLVPLFVGLRQKGQFKGTAMIAIIAATVIVITSASSTPISACAAGVAGLCFWPFRKRMRWFRWGAVTLLVTLHIIMEAPVWALIARVGVIGASSGYHRYMLIDQTIRHFGDWWLYGVKGTVDWGWNMGDTANQFVETAVTGGLATLLLLIALIACAFRKIGIARKSWEDSPGAERSLWALGVCLFSNVVAFFGITYFDQTVFVWYALLAMIASVKIAENKNPQEHPRFVESPADEQPHFSGTL